MSGLWVKVFPAPPVVKPELPGLGGWADITAVTGSPTKHEYTDAGGNDWTAYEWGTAGAFSATFTEGMIDVLIVGGGHSGYIAQTAQIGPGDRGWGGNGGGVVGGVYKIPAGAAAIAVGSAHKIDQPATRAEQNGKPSSLAGISWIAQGGASPGATNAGDGAGGHRSGNDGGSGIHSSITGVDKEYGRGGDYDTGPGLTTVGSHGHGGHAVPWNNPGGYQDVPTRLATDGCVIVRVPRANAKA